MTNINTIEAPERMLAYKTCHPGECLFYVSEAIRNGAPVLRNALTALDEWNATDGKHLAPSLPPGPGYPMFYTFEQYGDVCISGPNINPQVAIDCENGKYKEGVIGYETVAQREAQLGGRYLGWKDNIAGYDIVNTPVLSATQRLVGKEPSNIRNKPSTIGNVEKQAPANGVVTFVGYVIGQAVQGINIWYVTADNLYSWAGGYTEANVTGLPEITTTPLTSPPVVTTPIVTPPAVTVSPSPVTVTPTPAPAPVVSPPKKVIPMSTTPIVDINSSNAADIGTDLADVADATFTPTGRKKLYNVVTTTSAILTPVYALALASAAFFGGQVRDDILIGTGVTLVVDKIIGAFTTRLASKNVGI